MTTCSVQAIATHAHSSLALMGSGSGSRTAGSGSNSSSSSSPPIKTEPVQSPSTSASSTPVSPSVRRTPPVGLLNTCNLVQDEKLVVATLATLNSGDPSNIIKQDLRLIIQSRRKAEGKGELTVDFKTPPKDELTEEEEERARKRRDQNRLAAQRFRLKQRKVSSTLSEQQLTSEELEKRARRRELNRLAAKRSREKGQRRKDSLLQEIHSLQTHNVELECARTSLVEEKASLVQTLKVHVPHCHDPVAVARSAQLLAVSQRLTQLLDCPSPRLSVLLPAARSADPVSLPLGVEVAAAPCAASPALSGVEDLRGTPPSSSSSPSPSSTPALVHPVLPLHSAPHHVVAYKPLPGHSSSHTAPVLIPAATPFNRPLPPTSTSPSLSAYPGGAGMRTVASGQPEVAVAADLRPPTRGLEMDAVAAAALREEFQRRYPFRVAASTQVRAPRTPSPSPSPTHLPVSDTASSASSFRGFQLPSPVSPTQHSPLLPFSAPGGPHSYHHHPSTSHGGILVPHSVPEQDSLGSVVEDCSAVDRECRSVPVAYPVSPPGGGGVGGGGGFASETATFGNLHLHSPLISGGGGGLEREVGKVVRESQERTEFFPRALRGADRSSATLHSSSLQSGNRFAAGHFPSASEASTVRDSAVVHFRRGPVQRVASFHGTSLVSPAGEQLAPLNLSKRRNSEDCGLIHDGLERHFDAEASARGSGLHTWRGASWLKIEQADVVDDGEDDGDLPLNLVCREQPTLAERGTRTLRDVGALNLIKRESVDVSGFQDDDDITFASTSRKLTRYSSRDDVS